MMIVVVAGLSEDQLRAHLKHGAAANENELRAHLNHMMGDQAPYGWGQSE